MSSDSSLIKSANINTKNIQKPSLKVNVLISTLYQVLLVITPFITAPYISRVLGADGIGIISYTNSIVKYFSLFAALGIASYGKREISRCRDDIKLLSSTFWELQLLKTIISFIVILIWIGYLFLVKEYRIFFTVLSFALVNCMFEICWFFNGIEQVKYTVTKNSIIKLLEVISVFVFVKTKSDILLWVFIVTFAELFGTLSMWLSLNKFITKVDFRTLNIKRHFKETLVYFVPTISVSIYTLLDKILIGLITHDESQNGFYEQANKIIFIVKAITFKSLNSVIGTRIEYLYKLNKISEAKRRIEQSMSYILFLGFGFCFGIIGICKRFIPLFYGKGYEPVISLLYILCPIILIIGVSNCLGTQYYTPAGYRGKSSVFIIIGAIVNLICNLILIPRYGCYGASMGSIIAELTITALYFGFAKDFFTVNKFIKICWKKFIAVMVMFGAILFMDRLFVSNLFAIVTEIILGSLIYIGFLIILKDELILNLLGKVFKIVRR